MNSGKRKVVVTGVGAINGVGVGAHQFFDNLVEGKTGIDTVKRFDPTGMACTAGCEVNDDMWNPADYFKGGAKEVKRNDRFTHFAMAATKFAVEDSGIDCSKLDADMFGVLIGSGIGGIETLEKEAATMINRGHRRVSPFTIPAMIGNTASGLVAIELCAKGPNFGAVSACATGTHAIGEAMRYIESGLADVMICGGSEAAITPLSYAGFNNMRAMAQGFNDNPTKASRPFDAKRAGFVMGEGAGVLILESEEHALRRGASKVYCYASGYGANCDANHITAPDPEGAGLAKCLQIAMRTGEVGPEDVTYINAHGTSTPYNDKFETMAVKRALGDHAKKVMMSSTKSMTGHCLGAAGGLEAVVAVKSIETGSIPPTINYEEPDPDCDLDIVPNTKRTGVDVKVGDGRQKEMKKHSEIWSKQAGNGCVNHNSC